MKGQMVRMAVVTLLVFGLSAANAGTQKPDKATKPANAGTQKSEQAAKPAKPQIQTYTGTVKVTKDKAGQITDVKLNIGRVLPHKYSIILDNEGKELAAKMDGKRVEVKGLLQKKSGKTLLLVKQYNLVVPKTTTKKVVASKPVTTTAPKSTNATAPKSTNATTPKSTTTPAPR